MAAARADHAAAAAMYDAAAAADLALSLLSSARAAARAAADAADAAGDTNGAGDKVAPNETISQVDGAGGDDGKDDDTGHPSGEYQQGNADPTSERKETVPEKEKEEGKQEENVMDGAAVNDSSPNNVFLEPSLFQIEMPRNRFTTLLHINVAFLSHAEADVVSDL